MAGDEEERAYFGCAKCGCLWSEPALDPEDEQHLCYAECPHCGSLFELWRNNRWNGIHPCRRH
jgi:DNA-directed RNA polymerase subunit RPC12/RpoP